MTELWRIFDESFQNVLSLNTCKYSSVHIPKNETKLQKLLKVFTSDRKDENRKY